MRLRDQSVTKTANTPERAVNIASFQNRKRRLSTTSAKAPAGSAGGVGLYRHSEIEILTQSEEIDVDFAEAGAALEGQLVEDATLGQKLKQDCQHDFLLRDHDVAKAGFIRVTLDLRLREHS